MDTVNVHEAKTHLSRLLERVAGGDELIIAKNGTPVAKLVPISPVVRRPGAMKGQIHIHEDFDEPLPEEILRGFCGGSP